MYGGHVLPSVLKRNPRPSPFRKAFSSIQHRKNFSIHSQNDAYSAYYKKMVSAVSDKTRQYLGKVLEWDQSASNKPHSGTVFIPLERRSLLFLKGPDARQLLQGITTNHVEEGLKKESMASLFLNVKGRILFDCLMTSSCHSQHRTRSGHSDLEEKQNELIMLDIDVEHESLLKKHLTRYIMRSNVNILDSEEIPCQVFCLLSNLDEKDLLEIIHGWLDSKHVSYHLFKDQRFFNKGVWRLHIYQGQIHADPNILMKQMGNVHLEDDCLVYDQWRMINGIAEGSLDLGYADRLPLESNFEQLNAISFSKGCYVGQELTARTYHTGQTSKRILPIVLTDNEGELLHTGLHPTATLPPPKTKLIPVSDNQISGPSIRLFAEICSTSGSIGLALTRLQLITGDGESCLLQETSEQHQVFAKAIVPPWLKI